MHAVEPASTQESNNIMVKILDSTSAKADLKQVVNTSQINTEEITLLISLLEYFKDLFGRTLGNWTTQHVDLELKPYSKPFNSRFYTFPIINTKTFRKEIKRLVETGVLKLVQQIQYGNPVSIISN